jgi:hypothetical protein
MLSRLVGEHCDDFDDRQNLTEQKGGAAFSLSPAKMRFQLRRREAADGRQDGPNYDRPKRCLTSHQIREPQVQSFPLANCAQTIRQPNVSRELS